MDSIDEKIIETLREDSRTPFLKISKQLKVSEGTIRQRVKKLQQSGLIRSFTVRTANEVTAIVGIESEPNIETKKIVVELKELGINRIFEVTGRFDVLCFISASSMEKANDVLEAIRSIKGINHTETFTVLKES